KRLYGNYTSVPDTPVRSLLWRASLAPVANEQFDTQPSLLFPLPLVFAFQIRSVVSMKEGYRHVQRRLAIGIASIRLCSVCKQQSHHLRITAVDCAVEYCVHRLPEQRTALRTTEANGVAVFAVIDPRSVPQEKFRGVDLPTLRGTMERGKAVTLLLLQFRP